MLSEISESVAANNLHTHDMAIDVYGAGGTSEHNWQSTVELGMGRDDLYRRPNFIHLDAGPVHSLGG